MLSFSDRIEVPKHVLRLLEKEPSGGWQISAWPESTLLTRNRFGNLVRSGNRREDSSSQVSRRTFRMISRRGHSCWGKTGDFAKWPRIEPEAVGTDSFLS
jgi:hypothetical protein